MKKLNGALERTDQEKAAKAAKEAKNAASAPSPEAAGDGSRAGKKFGES